MARGRPRPPLVLSRDVLAELMSLVHSRTLGHDLVQRAEIDLRCADDMPNTTVADEMGVTRLTVSRWRERFR